MRYARLAVLTLIALPLALASLPASAQYMGFGSGTFYNNPGSALLDTMIWNRIHRQAMEQRLGVKQNQASGQATGSGGATTAPRKSPAAALTFKPSGSTAADEKLAKSLTENQGDRAKLMDAFKQIWSAYAEQAAAQGYKNDLGHALAFFVAGNWQVSRQKEVPSSAASALTRQMRQFLLSGGQLEGATNAQKEALAHTLVNLTAVIALGYQQAEKSGDETTKKNFAEGANNSLKALLGTGADRIAIGEKGMVIR